MAMWRAVCVLVLLAVAATEAATIQTYNVASCDGAPTNTFLVDGNTCQVFEGQSAVLISDVSSGTRVSIHNQKACEQSDQVAQIYGGGCVVQGVGARNVAFLCGNGRQVVAGTFISFGNTTVR